MSHPAESTAPLVLDGAALTLEDVLAVAQRRRGIVLSPCPEFRARIERGQRFLAQLLEEDGVVYGVTTGYGDACTRPVAHDDIDDLPRQLYTFHGCGMGQTLDAEAARAVVLVRLVSLCQGVSGVSVELLERLSWLLEHDVLPLIPEEGSVGASGDLTPLSYLAAVLCGEREVIDNGVQRPAAEALAERGLAPYRLKPKEGLALMNGTAVMTALGCLAFARCAYLAQLSTRITALSVQALDGNPYHFDADLFAAKPHPGQQEVAARLRLDLHAPRTPRNSPRLQDRYSTRCAPHVIGVVEDALPWWRQFLTNELNSANDNPLVDASVGKVMHGGHFYGGHVAFVMDSLKQATANLADLLDRQLALLVDSRYNHGLPSNLSGASASRLALNHGYKAVQIGASAWTAEALKLTMPASVFSRSTECHNQDKVSMGTIAARDALRILTLVEQVAAATLHAAAQGVELRSRVGNTSAIPERLSAFLDELRRDIAPLEEDRALDTDLNHLCTLIRRRHWSLYDA
ncbi:MULTISPECIES: histidine ammonia-lyase [Halomonas]|uniref:HAL/PAL/TAL family ammonia-lyase n=1 Tax=Halomonas TaxID=2745 RepID=UPI001A8CBEA8|nr:MULTISPECIES: aromatic amino acid ammonia-lyase [Halomonas]MBN8413930.1 aromatic amino acid lyase [Halomonas litopenaei]MBY5926868.1 aromatic amino acid ammonia-lyase [Halomonas sp. DP4Y7-2]MBY6233910.1 aromatic amino acid ammonia-lyase [Halomonas sp. DP4Y7-1]